MFNEYSDKGLRVLEGVEASVRLLSLLFGVSFKSPVADIARRFLNELREFESINKRDRRRIGHE